MPVAGTVRAVGPFTAWWPLSCAASWFAATSTMAACAARCVRLAEL